MAKEKISPLVHLPNGEVGAFFSPNCFFNLNVICPDRPKMEAEEPQDPVPWPGLPLSYKANVIAGANRMS
jgi:hypothetical protein